MSQEIREKMEEEQTNITEPSQNTEQINEKEEKVASKAEEEKESKERTEDELRKKLKDHFRGIEDETKINIREERLYNIPLSVAYNVPKTIRAERAVRELIHFVKRHTKTEHVYVSEKVNEALWKYSIEKPPRHIRVLVIITEEDGEKISRVLPAE
ncbi:MAG: 50S ribosomal protein L31e [Thermoprotei archaeon]|jgi:large subunit ribosomal protein L31e